MELTEERAIELSIELWEWLAETGKDKQDWPKWQSNGGEYPDVTSDCFLCEYAGCNTTSFSPCERCPYYQQYSLCIDRDSPYDKWEWAGTRKTSKKYAKQFLEQLQTLRGVNAT